MWRFFGWFVVVSTIRRLIVVLGGDSQRLLLGDVVGAVGVGS
jgi:hypothetical protein